MVALAVASCWWAWVDAASLIDVDGHNGHVLLAPLAIAVLVWVRRERLRHTRVGARPVGTLVAALGLGLLVAGGSQGVSVLYHGGALLVALGAFMSVCGKGVVLRMLPVTLALLFLIPIPGRVREAVGSPLREVTMRLVVGGLETLGVATARRDGSGQIVALVAEPDAVGVAAIADPPVGGTLLGAGIERVESLGPSLVSAGAMRSVCDGLPTLMVLLVVVYAYVFARPLRNKYRWLLIASTLLLAIVANVVRAAPLVWLLARPEDAAGTTLAEWAGVYSEWLAVPLGVAAAAGLVRLFHWSGLDVYRYRLAH